MSEPTVSAAEAEDPDFAAAVEMSRQEYADGLEQNLHRLAVGKDNVVANIVLAKKHRPNDFIERRQELHLHAHATVTDGEARALLAAMLYQATPATLAAIAPGQLPHTDAATRMDSGAERPLLLRENAAGHEEPSSSASAGEEDQA